MSHPNLSPQINANLEQSEKDGGIWLKDVPDNCVVEVRTQNTLYELKPDPTNTNWWLIKGHARFCPTWTTCRVQGSTWGGSMLKVGFIGIGMHLEVSLFASIDGEFGGTFTTTQIKEAWVK